MTPRVSFRAFALALIGLVLAAVVTGRMAVTTSITHFMASPEEVERAEISRALADSELARTMIFTVRGEDLASSYRAAERIFGILRHHPEVASLRLQAPEGVEEAVFDLYFPRRFMFADDGPPSAVAARLDGDGLRATAQALKRELALPTAAALKSTVPRDPWLLFPARLDALQAARDGDISAEDGRLVVHDDDGDWVVLFLTTHHSAFDGSAQGPLERTIEQALEEVGEDVVVERSAAHRFAVASERAIKADVARISVISILGIAILFVVAFRSLRTLAAAFLPLATGMLAATATTALWFGSVHGLTLAFGATLLGVCIDYPVHFFAHHTLEPDERGAFGTIRRIWPGLAIGALTSAVGFAALGWAAFPGLREMGLFATVGVLVALVTTRLAIPIVVPERTVRPVLLQRFAGRLDGLLDLLQDRTRWAWILVAVAVVICVIGLPRVRFIDDTRALNRLEITSLSEDRRVRARVSRVDASRVVVASGDDLESALVRNDAAFHRLAALREERGLQFRSLHPFLWSAALQRRNAEAFATAPDLADRIRAALVAQGFVAAAFEGLDEELTRPVQPLRLEDLARSPLGPVITPFVLELDDGQRAVLTFLRGDVPAAVVDAALEDLDGVELFDQQAFLAEVYGRYRVRTMELVGAGLLGVLAVIAWRYRRPRVVAAAFLPAVLAGTVTLALFGVLGADVHLLHLTALLLVSSMGVDYGVFLAESPRAAVAATLVGLCIACVSTVLGFGLLALSDNPAMEALGLTTGIGVVASLVFAPVALVLRGKR